MGPVDKEALVSGPEDDDDDGDYDQYEERVDDGIDGVMDDDEDEVS